MSFASSCALNRAGRTLAGPISVVAPLLTALESEMGRAGAPPEDIGLSCLAQSLEYMHSAIHELADYWQLS